MSYRSFSSSSLFYWTNESSFNLSVVYRNLVQNPKKKQLLVQLSGHVLVSCLRVCFIRISLGGEVKQQTKDFSSRVVPYGAFRRKIFFPWWLSKKNSQFYVSLFPNGTMENICSWQHCRTQYFPSNAALRCRAW